MADMQFEADQQNEFGRPPTYESAGITGKMVSWGLAKDRKQAEYILIGIVVVVLLIAVWLYANSGGDVADTPRYS